MNVLPVSVTPQTFGIAPPTVATSTVPTLPPPVEGCDGMQSALAAIFATLSQSSRLRNETSEGQVRINRLARNNAEKAVREATERAKRDAEDGGLFKKMTDNIGVLGVVGLATFNYGLVAADIGLHASGLVKNMQVDALDGACAVLAQTHPEIAIATVLLRKLDITPDAIKQTLADLHLGTDVPGISDEDVKPVVNTAVQLNLLIAGAAVSVLTAGSATALVVALIGVALSASAMVVEKAASDAPPWLTMGLQIGGAACSFGSGFIGSGSALVGASKLAAAKAVSGGVNAFNSGISGTDAVIHTLAQDRVERDNIDAKEARNQLTKLQRLLEDLIDVMSEQQDSHKRATGCVQKALDTHGQTLVATASAMKA